MKINTLHNEVNSLIAPIRGLLDVKFFGYVRFYTNDECQILGSDPALYEYCLNQRFKMTSDVPEEFINNDFVYFFNQNAHDDRYTEAVSGFSQTFQIDSFLDCITIMPEYYDMICYGADINNRFASTQYLNQLNLIKSFNKTFKDKSKKLLNEATRFKLPAANQNQALLNHATTSTHSLTLYADNEINKIQLTHAELRCAEKLASGFSAVRIGEDLTLSPRTVEFHTNNLKLKFNVAKKNELINLLNQCCL
jgi:DNA-binding CsgD family transcriptional regulator